MSLYPLLGSIKSLIDVTYLHYKAGVRAAESFDLHMGKWILCISSASPSLAEFIIKKLYRSREDSIFRSVCSLQQNAGLYPPVVLFCSSTCLEVDKVKTAAKQTRGGMRIWLGVLSLTW